MFSVSGLDGCHGNRMDCTCSAYNGLNKLITSRNVMECFITTVKLCPFCVPLVSAMVTYKYDFDKNSLIFIVFFYFLVKIHKYANELTYIKI